MGSCLNRVLVLVVVVLVVRLAAGRLAGLVRRKVLVELGLRGLGPLLVRLLLLGRQRLPLLGRLLRDLRELLELVLVDDRLAIVAHPREECGQGLLRRILVLLGALALGAVLVLLRHALAFAQGLHLLLVAFLVLRGQVLPLLLVSRRQRLPDLAGLLAHLGARLALQVVLLDDRAALLAQPDPVRGGRPLGHGADRGAKGWAQTVATNP